MTSRERYLIILNPIAGKGRAGDRRGEIERLLDERKLAYELVLTERPGHATELAYKAGSRGFSVATAVGGDGTVNEVINGLMRAHSDGKPVCTLGVICAGRGNDFAYGAGIPGDLEMDIGVLAAGYRQPLDAGLVKGGDFPDGKYFGNGIGIGFDTLVGLEAAKMTFAHGFMAYVLGALKTFILYPSAPFVRLEHDKGVIEQRSHQISIMNGKRMGGTFFMAPQASNRDSLLDLCMASEMSRGAMLKAIGMYTKGTQSRHPGIRVEKSESFRIEATSGGLVCHADGETICTDGKQLTVHCLPNRLSIICAKGES